MTASLNTLVPGSSGSCREAADWLKALTASANDASAKTTAARNTADAGWWGPASGRFHEVVYDAICVSDDLACTASTAEPALRDFADGLDKVNEKMQGARDTAVRGSLEVKAHTFIMAPDKGSLVTAPKPEMPHVADSKAIEEYNEAAAVYNAQMGEYNARVKVFNECSTLVKEARILEDQTHAALEGQLRIVMPKGVKVPTGQYPGVDGPPPANPVPWEFGGTSVSIALDSASEAQEQWQRGRQEAITRANKLVNEASLYQQLATGRRFADYRPTKAELAAVRRKARLSGLAKESQLALVRAYEKGLPPIWRSTEKWVALDGAGARAAASGRVRGDYSTPKFRKSVGGGLFVVGAAISVGGEVAKLVNGEQTWQGTAVKSVGLVAGNLIGGFVGGGALGPVGSVVLGATLEGAVDQFIEQLMPRDFDTAYNQPWVDQGQYAGTMTKEPWHLPR